MVVKQSQLAQTPYRYFILTRALLSCFLKSWHLSELAALIDSPQFSRVPVRLPFSKILKMRNFVRICLKVVFERSRPSRINSKARINMNWTVAFWLDPLNVVTSEVRKLRYISLMSDWRDRYGSNDELALSRFGHPTLPNQVYCVPALASATRSPASIAHCLTPYLRRLRAGRAVITIAAMTSLWIIR
jgi:hypothetical protein